MDAVRATTKNTKDIVAVLVEPLQGDAGLNQPPSGNFRALRDLCGAHNWLLILDEPQTRNARTGRYFAFQHERGLLPDVLTTAKGLGNGVPIGACLAAGKAAGILGAGAHGSTFGGNLLACAAAHAVLDAVEADDLEARASVLGERIRSGIESALMGSNRIKEMRGLGLMIGLELAHETKGIVPAALEKGLLINCIGDRIVRLLPALTMTDEEADELVSRLADTLKEL